MTSDQPEPIRKPRQRVSRRRQFAPPARACEILLVLVVIGSVLAIGSVHTSALLGVAALALVGGILSAPTFRRLPAPALVLGALGLFSAVQAIPLPASWVTYLSPVSAPIWSRCLAPFGERELVRFPVSLDAGASIIESLKWLTYAATYVMAARVRAVRGSAWLAALIFASASLVALITLLHGGADTQLLYGVYQPNFSVDRWSVGPLLNSNNFAGYALLGLFAGVGTLLSVRSPLPRIPSLAALGVTSTALLLSGSRGAVFSAIVCGCIVAVWLTTVQRARASIWQVALSTTPFLVGITTAIALGTAKNWAAIVSVDARRKVAVWEWSLPLIRDHLWLGVGRGAFETSLPPYRRVLNADWNAVFSHAENFVVQWLAEWGVPVGLSATLAIVAYIVTEWYGARADRTRFLLITGLAALFLQNLADLGLEVPAVAIAAVVALAAGERRSPREEPSPVARTNAFVAVPLAALWLAAAMWSRHPVEEERRSLSDAYHQLKINNSEARKTFRGQLREAMQRHPGESFFPLLGSLVAYTGHDESPLPWLGRALELAPANGPAHLVLAQLLASHKAITQAMLHLRLAAEYDGTLNGIAGKRAAQWASSLDVLMQAIPDGSTGDTMLATACSQAQRLELKVACFRKAVARTPKDGTLLGQFADSLLLAVRSPQPPCDNAAASCAAEVERIARAMAKLDPKSWRPGYLLARVLLTRNDAKGASDLLSRICPADAEGRDCEREAISAAIGTGSDVAVAAASDKYAARACEDSSSCAEALDWIGSTLEAAGKLNMAIGYYSKAAEAEGSSARWLRVAERATRANLFGVAKIALERANRSPDANPNSRAHADLLMRRVARGILPN